MPVTRRAFADRFDRTYIVNLPDRQDRLAEIRAQLAKAGIDPQGGRVQIFPAIKPESANGFPNAGARGCFLSHREILSRAIEDKLGRVLMIEDDLVLSGLAGSRSEEMLDGLDSIEWGIAYLGHSMRLPRCSPPRFLATTDSTIGSHFYAVQGEAIPLLVNYLNTVLTREEGDPLGGPMHYDGALTMFRQTHPEVITVAASEPLGYQGSSRSDITPRSWDMVPMLREVAPLLRRVKRFVTR